MLDLLSLPVLYPIVQVNQKWFHEDSFFSLFNVDLDRLDSVHGEHQINEY